MTDLINNPAHYGGKDNPYEAIKVIRDWGLGFNLGNAVKYLLRAKHKGTELQDLEKCRWYLQDALEHLPTKRGPRGVLTHEREQHNILCHQVAKAWDLGNHERGALALILKFVIMEDRESLEGAADLVNQVVEKLRAQEQESSQPAEEPFKVSSLAEAILALVLVWESPKATTKVYVRHFRKAPEGPKALAESLAQGFEEASAATGLEVELLVALDYHESAFLSSAKQPRTGAAGISQLHPRSRWYRHWRDECRDAKLLEAWDSRPVVAVNQALPESFEFGMPATSTTLQALPESFGFGMPPCGDKSALESFDLETTGATLQCLPESFNLGMLHFRALPDSLEVGTRIQPLPESFERGTNQSQRSLESLDGAHKVARGLQTRDKWDCRAQSCLQTLETGSLDGAHKDARGLQTRDAASCTASAIYWGAVALKEAIEACGSVETGLGFYRSGKCLSGPRVAIILRTRDRVRALLHAAEAS